MFSKVFSGLLFMFFIVSGIMGADEREQLINAVRKNNLESVVNIVKQGVRPHIITNDPAKDSVLHIAIRNVGAANAQQLERSIKIFNTLLSGGCDVNLKNAQGNTPLREALLSGGERARYLAHLLLLDPSIQVEAVEAPGDFGRNLSIPVAVGQGHEEIYRRFLNGALIYRPTPGSDIGMVILPIRELANPLEGMFDLSRCGDAGQYLSISTGYRKRIKPENSRKIEIWISPRFLIENELNGTAAHFKSIMGNWKQDAPVGVFWARGGWDNMGWYDYLTTKPIDSLSKIDLFTNWHSHSHSTNNHAAFHAGDMIPRHPQSGTVLSQVFAAGFHVSFCDLSRHIIEPSIPVIAQGIDRPVPLLAQSHEAIYQRFLNGALVYRPTPGNDVGMVTLPIRELANPLEGTFDLSRCGDTDKDLSISTGYRKGRKPENTGKTEIWFAPRFLIEKELNGTASYFKPIMGNWKQEASVGIFWTYGNWAANDHDMDYLVTKNMENLSKIDLHENWKTTQSPYKFRGADLGTYYRGIGNTWAFHIHFGN